MSAETFRAVLPFAAVLWMLAAPTAAFAFSQIGSEDGSSNQKDGIISVPLPPLPGEANVPAANAPVQGAPVQGAPVRSAPEAEEGEAVVLPAPNAPAAGAPSAPPPASTTPPPSSPASGTETAPGSGPTADPAPIPPSTGGAAPADAGTTDEGESSAVPDGGPNVAPAGPLPSATEDEDAPSDAAPDMSVPPARAPSGNATPLVEETVPPARIYYGEEGLPPAVRDLRQKLLTVARTGDIEALRPYLQTGEDATVLTFGGFDGDPVAYLKSASGDGEGVEVLAILLEVLQAGHVRSEADTDNEIFIWPYFTGVPIDGLSKPQKVELFEIVTAGDYQEMLGFGAYNFYRVGISPDGKLQFFVAGD